MPLKFLKSVPPKPGAFSEQRRALLAGTSWLMLLSLVPGRIPALAARLATTPEQVVGPYYPIALPPETDFDLTHMAGRLAAAAGQVIEIVGQVLGTDGNPVPGARIEIWQANTYGKYNHPRDVNPKPVDPNFQGYGVIRADDQGRYRFLTIKPGSYPLSPGWIRPPHVHFEVMAPGFKTLVTQMYFEGEELNKVDYLLKSATDPAALVVAFRPLASAAPPILSGTFQIVLEKADAP